MINKTDFLKQHKEKLEQLKKENKANYVTNLLTNIDKELDRRLSYLLLETEEHNNEINVYLKSLSDQTLTRKYVTEVEEELEVVNNELKRAGYKAVLKYHLRNKDENGTLIETPKDQASLLIKLD